MDIGRVRRRFTAEPTHSPVPGAERPVPEPTAAEAPAPVESAPGTDGARVGADAQR